MPHAGAAGALSAAGADTAQGFTTGLAGLRRASPRWLVAGTLVSLGLLVQVPAASAWLGLRPLHAADWGLVGLALVLTAEAARRLAASAAKPFSSP
jgi:hypothetical protein